jgi:coenzyme F420 hydrogenase subunit beta
MNYKMSKVENVSSVIKDKLCIGCGLCYSICPANAILWDKSRSHVPDVIEDKCVHCKICMKICPSVNFENDYLSIYRDFKSYLVGPVERVFLSYSTDDEIRRDASSGGFITEFLTALLEKGVIIGAIVVTSNPADPFMPRVIIAKNKADIKNAKGSKYTIASTGLLLGEIMRTDGKFAVVGTPCQILAFRRAEKIFKELKEKIVVYVGLFCGHVMYPEGYRMIIEKETGKTPENVKDIKYRGSGWPGYLSIFFKDKTTLKLPYNYWVKLYFSSLLFTPKRCLMCNDSTCELADIAVGDPWLPWMKNTENEGMSLVVIRTKRGLQLVEKTKRPENLWFKQVSAKYILISQKPNISYKKFNSYLFRRQITGSSEVIGGLYIKNNLITNSTSFFGIWVIRNIGILVEKYCRILPRSILKLYSTLLYLLVQRITL